MCESKEYILIHFCWCFRFCVFGLIHGKILPSGDNDHLIRLQLSRLCNSTALWSKVQLTIDKDLIRMIHLPSIFIDRALPGHLPELSTYQVKILTSSLHSTYEVAMEFDSRPGLKFLLQKVSEINSKSEL